MTNDKPDRNGRLPGWIARHWPWLLGIVFAAGAVAVRASSTAKELPGVRDKVAQHETAIELNKKRLDYIEGEVKEFKAEQKEQSRILRGLERALLRGSHNRRRSPPDDPE